ncbi:MAG: aldehyde dehydrogenase family protein, partial [Candidatus Sulfotelmatobacter sp.]
IGVRVVENVEEAIDHINRYSTKHSDSIVTRDEANARKFLRSVDSAAVYWNASTRFTDGAEFGFGAEMGISTQKLHCRGPFALAELTSSKYEIVGTGQVR